MPRDTIFVSYARSDASARNALVKQLEVALSGTGLRLFADSSIEIGEEWKDRIREELDRARIVVLLVSADFLTSEFVQQVEIPRAALAARRREAVIACLFVQHCRANRFVIHVDDPEEGGFDVRVTDYQGLNDPDEPLMARKGAKRAQLLAEVSGQIVKLAEERSGARSISEVPAPVSSSEAPAEPPGGKVSKAEGAAGGEMSPGKHPLRVRSPWTRQREEGPPKRKSVLEPKTEGEAAGKAVKQPSAEREAEPSAEKQGAEDQERAGVRTSATWSRLRNAACVGLAGAVIAVLGGFLIFANDGRMNQAEGLLWAVKGGLWAAPIWAVAGAIAGGRRLPLMLAAIFAVVVLAAWIGIFGTYQDVMWVALIMGSPGAGIVGATIGWRLLKRRGQWGDASPA